MEYRRNRRNEERGKDRRMAGDQNGEIDWLDEDSGTIKVKRKLGEKRSLPKPGPVMIALLAMLLLAGSADTGGSAGERSRKAAGGAAKEG